MRSLPGFNFLTLTTYSKALAEIEKQIRILIELIDECDDTFTDEDRAQLVQNIKWLKRYYEAAERAILNETNN